MDQPACQLKPWLHYSVHDFEKEKRKKLLDSNYEMQQRIQGYGYKSRDTNVKYKLAYLKYHFCSCDILISRAENLLNLQKFIPNLQLEMIEKYMHCEYCQNEKYLHCEYCQIEVSLKSTESDRDTGYKTNTDTTQT